jgi:hypothetical protein
VLLGAYLAATGFLALDAVETALDNHLSERQRRFLASNKEALRRGAACVAHPRAGVPAAAMPLELTRA